MTPHELVEYVAAHDPASLPEHPDFAWSAPLSAGQREQMHEEALEALAFVPEPDDEDASTLIEPLAADWHVARILMGRPEFAASVKPEWRVSQFWFWSPEWQAKEREADADYAAGRFTRYDSDEEFLASLEERRDTGTV